MQDSSQPQWISTILQPGLQTQLGFDLHVEPQHEARLNMRTREQMIVFMPLNIKKITI
jgi:hypothetical protein